MQFEPGDENRMMVNRRSHGPPTTINRFIMAKLRLITGGQTQASRRLGPPPPWMKQADAAKRCANCDGRCVQSCPKSLILRHPGQHRLNGQPYFDFSRDGCDFCGECVEECDDIAAIDGQPRIGLVEIDASRCLNLNGDPCSQCLGKCDAISLIAEPKRLTSTTHSLHINFEQCVGCGQCVSACPTDALSVQPL